MSIHTAVLSAFPSSVCAVPLQASRLAPNSLVRS